MKLVNYKNKAVFYKAKYLTKTLTKKKMKFNVNQLIYVLPAKTQIIIG